jgi:predicted RNase H-like HicB family nuclease
MRYAIAIEKAEGNYSAYIPDLPGCVTVEDTVEELMENMREAVEMHLEALQEDGLPIPEARTMCEYIELPTAMF